MVERGGGGGAGRGPRGVVWSSEAVGLAAARGPAGFVVVRVGDMSTPLESFEVAVLPILQLPEIPRWQRRSARHFRWSGARSE